MTRQNEHSESHLEDISNDCAPMEPWLAELTHDVNNEVVVPRELMWARIQKERSRRAPVVHRGSGIRWTSVIALAATLFIGVAIGRFASPAMDASSNPSANVAITPGQDLTVLQQSSPVRVAMNEHLAKTAMLLASVGTQAPNARPAADMVSGSRELLTTTRILLDSPELLADHRMHRLLEDLELVLVQIIQSRGTSAPEVRRAPTETLRETNLLPRVREAVITASAGDPEPGELP